MNERAKYKLPSVVINTATAIRYYAFKEDMTNPRMHTRNEQKADEPQMVVVARFPIDGAADLVQIELAAEDGVPPGDVICV